MSKSDYISKYKKANPIPKRNDAEWKELFEAQSELVDLVTVDNSRTFIGVDASLLLLSNNENANEPDDDDY